MATLSMSPSLHIELLECFNSRCHIDLYHEIGTICLISSLPWKVIIIQSFVLLRTIKVCFYVFLEMDIAGSLLTLTFTARCSLVVVGGGWWYISICPNIHTSFHPNDDDWPAITQCSRCPGNIFSSIN